MFRILAAILFVGALIGIYIWAYLNNKKTPVPKGCENLKTLSASNAFHTFSSIPLDVNWFLALYIQITIKSRRNTMIAAIVMMLVLGGLLGLGLGIADSKLKVEVDERVEHVTGMLPGCLPWLFWICRRHGFWRNKSILM